MTSAFAKQRMYQIEVKRYLIERLFHPSHGWMVTVDLDAMELGKGEQNTQEKREIADTHRRWMEDNGIAISPHPEHGRVDIVAHHPIDGKWLIECEGDTKKQKEQAMYSSLGQLVLLMNDSHSHYALAFPLSGEWSSQAAKIPRFVRDALALKVFLVSDGNIREG